MGRSQGVSNRAKWRPRFHDLRICGISQDLTQISNFKISRFQRFHKISLGSLNFMGIIGKNIAWDFGSRISSKISAQDFTPVADPLDVPYAIYIGILSICILLSDTLRL